VFARIRIAGASAARLSSRILAAHGGAAYACAGIDRHDHRDRAKVWCDPNGGLKIERERWADGDRLTLIFGELCEVTVAPQSRRLHIENSFPASSWQAVDHFLLDQVIPRILAHEGHLVLHAGLVAAPKSGLIVCGPSGRGKSTLVASLQRAGYELHGDDALVVDKRGAPFLGKAVYPSLRVLPDTLERVFPEGTGVRSIAHYSDKLQVSLPLDQSDPLRAVPLSALLFLPAPPAEERIALRRMRPAEACMALIENSFALDPTDRDRARDKLELASDLASAVPAFELSYPRDYGLLDDVRRTLVNASILPPLDVGIPCPERSA
jgi:hypothetical protein